MCISNTLENEILERHKSTKQLRRLGSSKNFESKLKSTIQQRIKSSWFNLSPADLLINLISKRHVKALDNKIIQTKEIDVKLFNEKI